MHDESAGVVDLFGHELDRWARPRCRLVDPCSVAPYPSSSDVPAVALRHQERVDVDMESMRSGIGARDTPFVYGVQFELELCGRREGEGARP